MSHKYQLAISEGGARYLRQCEIRLKPRTVEGRTCTLNAFFSWCDNQGYSTVDQLGIDQVEEYEAYLARYRQPYNEKPLCKATIRNRLTAVKMMFKFLFRKGVIHKDISSLIELPRVPRQLPKGYLDLEEIDASLQQPLLHDIKGLRDRAILEVYAASGVRRMELANLTIDDIDFKQYVVTVRQGKGDRDRCIPIASATLT
jgi:integrase/recombinase XerD